MRKIALLSILILLITNKTIAHSIETDEMTKLATIVKASDLEIENWQVTIKETKEHVEMDKIVEKLKDSYLVTMKEDENSLIYSFEDVQKKGDIVESYKAVIPKKTIYNAELIVELNGNVWNEKIKGHYTRKLMALHTKFFTDPKIYACLTTGFSGIIDSDILISNLTKKLSLLHVNTQYDNVTKSKHKKIIYGYTPLWRKQTIMVDEPVNIQIAISNNDESGKVQHTIGTPLLINEY